MYSQHKNNQFSSLWITSLTSQKLIPKTQHNEDIIIIRCLQVDPSMSSTKVLVSICSLQGSVYIEIQLSNVFQSDVFIGFHSFLMSKSLNKTQCLLKTNLCIICPIKYSFIKFVQFFYKTIFKFYH